MQLSGTVMNYNTRNDNTGLMFISRSDKGKERKFKHSRRGEGGRRES